MPGANAMWNTNGQALPGDVAARDVQAATSSANRIAHARTKAWRFAGGGEGGRDAEVAKAKALNGAPSRKLALSGLPAMCPDRDCRGTSLRSAIAKGRAKVCEDLQRSAGRSRPQRKAPQSLAAQTTGFGLVGQTLAPAMDCVWRGVMLRIVRLAMDSITFSR